MGINEELAKNDICIELDGEPDEGTKEELKIYKRNQREKMFNIVAKHGEKAKYWLARKIKAGYTYKGESI